MYFLDQLYEEFEDTDYEDLVRDYIEDGMDEDDAEEVASFYYGVYRTIINEALYDEDE